MQQVKEHKAQVIHSAHGIKFQSEIMVQVFVIYSYSIIFSCLAVLNGKAFGTFSSVDINFDSYGQNEFT